MTSIDYECESCGTWHRGADGTPEHPWPMIDALRPDALLHMSAAELLTRVQVSEEVCIVATEGEPDCYLSSHLVLPVRGEEAQLTHRVWMKIAVEDYLDLLDHWEDPFWHGVFEGTLANRIPGYDLSPPFPMRVSVRGRKAPEFLPAPEDSHALARDMRQGITRQEAELRVRTVLLEDLEPERSVPQVSARRIALPGTSCAPPVG